ncbi:MAG: RNA-guided pseudouridylation complex pseudouridine synthase subunit Cbf5 [Candidatus Hadarchaeales archaeon]
MAQVGNLPCDLKRSVLTKAHDVSDPSYGCEPRNRKLQEYMKFGAINLDKPRGPTSHEVTAWVKRILGVEKAGHGGTLDPSVSGVLVVAIGDATKVLQAFLPAGKEYVCVMHLHGDVGDEKLAQVLKEFTGRIYQKPPLRAAVRRQVRTREIYYIELIERDGRNVLMRVGCEAGTYMRKLCHDIGEAIGCGAHMKELRRTRVGTVDERVSVTLQDVADAYAVWKENGEEKFLRKAIVPIEELLGHLPKLVVRDGAVDALCHGADLAAPGVLKVDSGIKRGGLVGVFTLKGELIELARTTMDSEEIVNAEHGIVARPERVVMLPGTYPKMWKS